MHLRPAGNNVETEAAHYHKSSVYHDLVAVKATVHCALSHMADTVHVSASL